VIFATFRLFPDYFLDTPAGSAYAPASKNHK
jgi:hypothetical protein